MSTEDPIGRQDLQILSDGPEASGAMPLPQNTLTLVLIGIFILMLLTALRAASEVVLPIVFALVFHLLLQPSMRLFARLHIPKMIAALLIVSTFCGGAVALGYELSGPAARWLAKAPASLPRLEARLLMFKKPVEDIQKASDKVDKITETAAPNRRSVSVAGPKLSSSLFSGTRSLLAGMLTTVILLFFLLSSGDLFLRRFVEVLPTLANKKQAVDIAHEVESNISKYLLTISLMNAAIGIATGIIAWLCGLSDPVLWGATAFLLNYVPILGPIVCTAILFLAGLLTFDSIWAASLPAGLYFLLHLIEGETLTPLLLARRFTLNPVLVVASLVFWFWMWGVAGAFLAVPMLATTKIICDRIRPLMALGHFLGADARR